MDLKAFSNNELRELIGDIETELHNRTEEKYKELLKNFFDAFDELAYNFPNKKCFLGKDTTWEDLYSNYAWLTD